MGFKFKAPKIKLDSKSLKNVGKNLTGYISPLYSAMNKKPEEMQLPGESAEQTALRKRLYGEAQDFRSNLGEMQGDARNNITRGANAALESGERGVRTSMNQRGMLYSGMREAGEQGVRSRVASTAAGQTAQSNKELENMASKKEQVAASVGLDSYRDAVAREAEATNMRMANSVARAQAMQQLGQGMGYAAGAYSGMQRPATEPSAQPTYSGTAMGGGSNLNAGAMAKGGGALAPSDMLADKNALGASKQYVAPQPVAQVAPAQPAAPANTGLGSAARRAVLNRLTPMGRIGA